MDVDEKKGVEIGRAFKPLGYFSIPGDKEDAQNIIWVFGWVRENCEYTQYQRSGPVVPLIEEYARIYMDIPIPKEELCKNLWNELIIVTPDNEYNAGKYIFFI